MKQNHTFAGTAPGLPEDIRHLNGYRVSSYSRADIPAKRRCFCGQAKW